MKIVVFTILLAVVVEWGEAGFKSKTLELTCPEGTEWFGKLGEGRVTAACCKTGLRLVMTNSATRCCPTDLKDEFTCNTEGCICARERKGLGTVGVGEYEGVKAEFTVTPLLKKTAEESWGKKDAFRKEAEEATMA